MEENDEGRRRRRRRVMMSNPIAFAASRRGRVLSIRYNVARRCCCVIERKEKEKRARFWKDIRSRGS